MEKLNGFLTLLFWTLDENAARPTKIKISMF
jgi:hypothetical protein